MTIRSHRLSAVLPVRPDVRGWNSGELAKAMCDLARSAGFHPMADVGTDFEPFGASAVVLLQESHVAVHLWPELNKLTLDIHVCDYSQDNQPGAERLAGYLVDVFCPPDCRADWAVSTVEG